MKLRGIGETPSEKRLQRCFALSYGFGHGGVVALRLLYRLGMGRRPNFPSPRGCSVLAAPNSDVEVARFQLNFRHRRTRLVIRANAKPEIGVARKFWRAGRN